MSTPPGASPLGGTIPGVGATPTGAAGGMPPAAGMEPMPDDTGGESGDTGDGFEVIATLMFNKESGVYRLYHGDEPEAGGEEEGGEGGTAAAATASAAGGEGGEDEGAGGAAGTGGDQGSGEEGEGAEGGEEEGGEGEGGETEHEDFDSIGAMMKGVMELAKDAESGEGDGFEAGFDDESGGGDNGGEPMPPTMSKGKGGGGRK